MANKETTPQSLYESGREFLREQIRTNEILADIAGAEYTPPEGVPNGKYMQNKWLLDAAQKKNELLEEIAEGGAGGGGGAAKAIGIDYATDGIFLENKDGDPIQGSGATLPAYGVTFDPSTGGLTLTKNGTAVQGQTVTIPNYGSPVGVDASADMTDHDKIYLYEGTTGGGYTNGHFYYWDGSAWADGGEYAAATVQTDKTLLVEDRAADAKATGDAVAELKTHLDFAENEIFEESAATVDSTASGWRLNESDGLSSSNANYKLVKYKVTAGDIVKVISDDRFQFQTSASVPATGTSNRVGATYGKGTYYLDVPDTAEYLIVSTPTDSNSAVYFCVSIKDTTERHERQIQKHETQIIDSLDGTPFIDLFNDKDEWYNVYFGSDGTPTKNSKNISPMLEPMLVKGGCILKFVPDSYTASVSTYTKSGNAYTRITSKTYSETTIVTYSTDTYLTVHFSSDSTITPPVQCKVQIKSYYYDEIAKIKDDIDTINNNFETGNYTDEHIVNGTFNGSGGLTTASNRLRLKNFLTIKKGQIVTIKNGSLSHAVGMWNGTPSATTNKRNDQNFITTDETIICMFDGFLMVAFRDESNPTASISVSDYDGEVAITIYPYANTLDEYVPEYYFANDYLNDKVDRIKELGMESDDVFIFITDIHWESNARNSPYLVSYIRENCNIARVIDGGDDGNGNQLECYNLFKKASNGTIRHVVGNHDWYSPATGKSLYYGMDVCHHDQEGNPFRHYWFVDNKQQKIRYIILSGFNREPGGNLEISYESDQINWFENVALNVPNDYDVIVFTHFLKYVAEPTESYLSIENIIDSFNADMNRTGKILSVFQGHTHWDAIYHTTDGLPVITTTCDKYDFSMEPEVTTERIKGTISEQAFDVVCLNRAEKKFTLIRIGALAQNNIDKYKTDTGFTWVGTLEERTVTY